ncbi:MAG TPA: response regulator transcription factor [Vicinamibacterales bacterium]|nr:response regulator transcription factor [Vicinamibacterales bacterium]
MDEEAPQRVRIVLADDHQMFRDAVRRLLDAEPDLVVVGEAGDGEEAVALTLQYEPDILLLDVAMPHANGMEVLQQIAAASKVTRIIMVTGAVEESELRQALRLGARGFVLKESGAAQLLESIRVVHGGEYFVGRECMADLVSAVRSRGVAIEGRAPRKADFGLTTRERQIVSAVVNAYQNKEIAEKFAISEKTVKHHLTNIFNKVGVSNRLELALFAVHHRLDSSTL